MKILMVLSNPFVNDSRVHNEAASLINAGHEVRLIAWDRTGKYEKNELVNEIDVYRISNNFQMRILQKPLLQIPFFWSKAIKLAKRFKFDAIHCHDLDTLYIGIQLKKILNTKLIYDAHEIYTYLLKRDLSKYFIPLFKKIEKSGKKYVDELIIADDSYLEYFQSLGYSQITTVLNTKNLYLKRYQSPQNETITLIYIGSLTKPRFIVELIEVVGEIPYVRLIIAGRGRLAETINQEAKKYRNIDFLGELSFEKVIPLTHQNDISICMINPNDKNNQIASANKQFEAMVAARPIIATKGTRSGEITAQENCGLVIDYNKGALKEAIEKLRDDPALRKQLGLNALTAAKEKYNWEIDKQRLLNVYSKFEKH